MYVSFCILFDDYFILQAYMLLMSRIVAILGVVVIDTVVADAASDAGTTPPSVSSHGWRPAIKNLECDASRNESDTSLPLGLSVRVLSPSSGELSSN